MTTRAHNFNAGPAALPLPVLQQAQAELLDFGGTGMSILESSHRGPVYDEIHQQAIADLKVLFGGSDDHTILFMGGGAQTQFALIPMNLLPQGEYAEYLETGVWGEAAREEAAKVGDARTLWSSSPSGHDRVPGPDDYEVSADAVYLHYTSNNSIMGTQFHTIPRAGNVPLVCDMSSDILTYPIDLKKFGLIYGGAQKNLGAAGVTLVVIRQDMLDRCRSDLPTMLSYTGMAATNSLQNTPPVFAIYIVGLIARHILDQGGMTALAARNEKKAALLYGAVDGSGGFYQGPRAAREPLPNERYVPPAKQGTDGAVRRRSCHGRAAGLEGTFRLGRRSGVLVQRRDCRGGRRTGRFHGHVSETVWLSARKGEREGAAPVLRAVSAVATIPTAHRLAGAIRFPGTPGSRNRIWQR